MADLFWLSEARMARLQPLLPNKPRVDDRRVISGIVQVLISGGRRVDAPAIYGPRRTLYNRWVRWARAGVWRRAFAELAAAGDPAAELMLDSTHARGRRKRRSLRCRRARRASAQATRRSRGGHTTKLHALVDGQGRPVAVGHDAGPARRSTGRCRPARPGTAGAPCDGDALRQVLPARGITPVIPNNPRPKRHHPFERSLYKRRNVTLRTFCRLKDFRRVATRYDRLACTCDAAVCLAAIVIWWS